jgi:prophage regulatory protein
MGNLIWREPKVKEKVGLSKSTIWRLMKVGDFPQKIQLGPRAVGWRAEEIIQWCRERCEATNRPVGKNKGKVGSVDPEGPREG